MAPILLLFLAAAPSAPPSGVRTTALATATILPGARIALASQTVRQSAVEPQRSLIRRAPDGAADRVELRLVEFQ